MAISARLADAGVFDALGGRGDAGRHSFHNKSLGRRGNAMARWGVLLHWRRGRAVFLAFVALAFFARGLFYCVEQPIWEGYDEWAHFAYIQHIAEHRHLPERTDRVSDQVRRSLDLVPLSSSAAGAVPGAIPHDAFGRLPIEERLRRTQELRELNAAYKHSGAGEKAMSQYEAQQPPLYYILLTPLYLAVKSFPLPAQVLVLRIASLSISAMALLLAYGIARQIAAARRLAVLVPVMLASFSGVLIDVCHVGNDSLAVAVGSAVVLCAVRLVAREREWSGWIALGTALAAALLTKAYFLAFVPLAALLAILQVLRRRASAREAIAGCGLAFAIAALGAGWWYFRTWILTGTLSGEEIDAAAASVGVEGKLAAVWHVHWLRVLDSAAFSHIWTGGWSFLGVRSWMYRVFELLACGAATGVAVLIVRAVVNATRRRTFSDAAARFAVVVSAYLLIVVGICYYALVVFLVKGVSVALGWYLYAAVGAEIVLFASGFTGLLGTRKARYWVASTCLLALVFDLYTMHFVLVPYYTGLIRHRPSGPLEAFRMTALGDAGIGQICSHLGLNEYLNIGPAAIAVIWAAYLIGTFALMAFSAAQFRQPALARNLSRRGGLSKSSALRC